MIDVAGFAALFTDGSPRLPGRAPHLESTPVPAARVPKWAEEPGGIAAAEQPVEITLRGVKHTLPDWHMEEISYTKRTDAEREALRAQSAPARDAFLKDLAANDTVALHDAGISDADIATMADGDAPSGYEVHHKLPLDDGGTNAATNLMLIKKDPDHYLITQYQLQETRGMSPGQTRTLEWPMPDLGVRIWPRTPEGGAYSTVHKLEWLMPDAYFQRTLTRRAGMSDIDDLLAAIDARVRKFGHVLRSPASLGAIERLRRYAKDTLRTDLPEGYLILPVRFY